MIINNVTDYIAFENRLLISKNIQYYNIVYNEIILQHYWILLTNWNFFFHKLNRERFWMKLWYKKYLKKFLKSICNMVRRIYLTLLYRWLNLLFPLIVMMGNNIYIPYPAPNTKIKKSFVIASKLCNLCTIKSGHLIQRTLSYISFFSLCCQVELILLTLYRNSVLIPKVVESMSS